jgi:hypothetical protein
MTTPLRRQLRPLRVLALVALAVVASACAAFTGAQRELAFNGPDDGDLLNAESVAEVTFVVEASSEDDDADLTLEDIVFELDGTDVTADTRLTGTSLVYAPGELADGDRTLRVLSVPVTADGDEPGEPEELHVWTFAVDATPPEIELTGPEGAVVAGEAVTVEGITEPGAVVAVGDQETTAGEDGSFSVELPSPPEGDLLISATDAAGNTASEGSPLVVVPSRVEVDEIRTVHVSFCGWATPSLRDPVLAQIDAGLINAVQLDLKDETGKVGFDTDVDFAERIGSNQPDCRIDLEAAVAQLHDLGVPVIGRIVAFADPVLGPWAWANDERELVIQTADGSDFYTGRYNGFANFANPEVVDYNLDVAEEAAAMGVDHILWDYLRKPDGPLENMTIPGLESTVEDAVYEFTRLADERLAPYGVQHGASLYGVSADRPWEVGQDVERLAEVLDYVAPMIYPSHWGPGEYGVADPLMQPGEMVAATLEVWLEATEGKRARVAPWLEDSNWPVRLGFPDRARYVREQIQATYDAGISEWLLWDSAVRYTESAMIQPS